MNAFYQTFLDLLETIEESLTRQRIIPCLILIYSGIDSISYLASDSDRSKGIIFQGWVKKWMLCQNILPCNESDIYSARCGIVHQQISESDMTRTQKAKAVYYCWGNKNSADLQAIINDKGKQNEEIAVKIEDLLLAFSVGVVSCLDEIEKDFTLKKSFEEKARKMFFTFEVS